MATEAMARENLHVVEAGVEGILAARRSDVAVAVVEECECRDGRRLSMATITSTARPDSGEAPGVVVVVDEFVHLSATATVLRRIADELEKDDKLSVREVPSEKNGDIAFDPEPPNKAKVVWPEDYPF
jgi:hypothetical protein